MNSVTKNTATEVTKRDKKVIAAQLKRPPRELIKIAKRCSYGQPQVIMTSPLLAGNRKNFFPTLFWLTCPYLNKEIARLEGRGWVGKLQDKLATDRGFLTKMEKAHHKYRDLRQSLIKNQLVCQRLKSPACHCDLPASARHKQAGAQAGRQIMADRPVYLSRKTREGGVGGIADPSKVKCLHAHFAHYLATGDNPIGKFIHKKIKNVVCTRKPKECQIK